MSGMRTTDEVSDLIEILRARTRFLERILSHSRSYGELTGETTEIHHLDRWLMKRERLFHTYELAEKRVEQLSHSIIKQSFRIPLTIQSLIENEMDRAQALIAQIKDSDDLVVIGIRETQERLLKQIQESRSLKEKLGRFRSDIHRHRGEELDAKG